MSKWWPIFVCAFTFIHVADAFIQSDTNNGAFRPKTHSSDTKASITHTVQLGSCDYIPLAESITCW